MAEIRRDGQVVNLGRFDDEESAAQAYDRMTKQIVAEKELKRANNEPQVGGLAALLGMPHNASTGGSSTSVFPSFLAAASAPSPTAPANSATSSLEEDAALVRAQESTNAASALASAAAARPSSGPAKLPASLKLAFQAKLARQAAMMKGQAGGTETQERGAAKPIRQSKMCRCGSVTHLRVSHRDCPLNPAREAGVRMGGLGQTSSPRPEGADGSFTGGGATAVAQMEDAAVQPSPSMRKQDPKVGFKIRVGDGYQAQDTTIYHGIYHGAFMAEAGSAGDSGNSGGFSQKIEIESYFEERDFVPRTVGMLRASGDDYADDGAAVRASKGYLSEKSNLYREEELAIERSLGRAETDDGEDDDDDDVLPDVADGDAYGIDDMLNERGETEDHDGAAISRRVTRGASPAGGPTGVAGGPTGVAGGPTGVAGGAAGDGITIPHGLGTGLPVRPTPPNPDAMMIEIAPAPSRRTRSANETQEEKKARAAALRRKLLKEDMRLDGQTQVETKVKARKQVEGVMTEMTRTVMVGLFVEPSSRAGGGTLWSNTADWADAEKCKNSNQPDIAPGTRVEVEFEDEGEGHSWFDGVVDSRNATGQKLFTLPAADAGAFLSPASLSYRHCCSLRRRRRAGPGPERHQVEQIG
jgi:hypothetical protein